MSVFGAGGFGGKGGGGSGGRKEAKDNLDSTAYAKIVELLSEGEIEGFATPSRLGLARNTQAYMNASMKDMYFNDTALLNATADNNAPDDSDFNFRGVTVATRFGEQNQDYVPGFEESGTETVVNATVIEGSPVSSSIDGPNLDAIRLTVNVPSLQLIKDNGDIVGSEIDLEIATQYSGELSYTTVISDRIAGRTSDSYQRSYLINITGTLPVNVRVTRITPNSNSAKLSNAFSWSTYSKLIYQKLAYPNTAYVALRVDAEQFSNIPERSYRIRGIKVRIPNNATVDLNTGRLTYSGVWNGTFGAAAWTTDPAWILWDLLTSSRYGLGDHIQEASLDKWAFFRASQYCNELVSTGLSAPNPPSEPRFSCNVNIQTQEEAYKLINDMCSVFRAMPFWAAGSLTVAQDRPSDPVSVFSLSNVTSEGFSYEGSSIKSRATVVIVSWLNLELKDIDREVVEDAEGIAKYGVITKEVSAFATTSRSQAHRIGEWLLYTERNETELVSFTTGLENGIVLRPGSIIEIADPLKSGLRRGGRINSATDTVITVDNSIDLPSAGILSVILPDAIVESRTIASSGVVGDEITVNTPFSTAPLPGSVWLLDDATVAPRPSQWRVLAVEEKDGINCNVVAVKYDSSKYAFVESGAALQPRATSVLAQPPAAPVDLRTLEVQYETNGRVATKLVLSWKPVSRVNEYRVRWRGEFNNWQTRTVYGPIYEIENVDEGVYQVEVYSISASLVVSSSPSSLEVTVVGIGAPPADVTGVSLVPVNESSAIIQWDLATDLDVLVGGEVLIRHDPRGISIAEWSASNAIVQAAAGNQTQKQVPLLAGTYFLAFKDQSGVRSLNPFAIAAVLPTPQPRLTVKTWAEQDESPKFNGTSTNLTYDAGLNGLFLDPSVAASGVYQYEDTLDMGAVYDVNLLRRVVSSPSTVSGVLFDSVPGLFDAQLGDFDGSDLDVVNAVTYVRATNDDPSGTPTWGPWNEYANAIIRARGIQLKVEGISNSAQAGLLVTELGATAELQQRTETASDSGSSSYNVVYADPFYAAPDVTISPSNMATGDYFTLTSITRTGFTVAFKNSSDTPVIRSFTYTAVGFGREV